MNNKGSSTKGMITAIAIGIVLFIIYVGMNSENGSSDTADAYYQEISDKGTSPQMTESEFKSNCIDISSSENYKTLLRYPEQYKGTMVCLNVCFSNTHVSGNCIEAYTYNPSLGTYMGDQYVMVDKRTSSSARFIDGDIVNVYGFFEDLERFETVVGTEKELPYISIIYADIVG